MMQNSCLETAATRLPPESQAKSPMQYISTTTEKSHFELSHEQASEASESHSEEIQEEAWESIQLVRYFGGR